MDVMVITGTIAVREVQLISAHCSGIARRLLQIAIRGEAAPPPLRAGTGRDVLLA